MTISVYINQELAGTLTVTRDGLYTVLEAEVPHGGGLVRLWAHGGGKSAYLGVMQPWNGGLWLRRRLSRRELAAFPDPIESVSDRERDGDEATERGSKDLHNEVNIKEETPSDAVQPDSATPEEPEQESTAPEKAESLHNAETDYSACPWPAQPPEDGLLWYARGDGSLTAFDGVSSLLALPAELRTSGAQTVERVIEGKKYLVFRY